MLRLRRSFLFVLLGFLALALAAQAQVHVRGYFRKDGTYVRPHLRTYPDGNPYNNYSFPGNYNPNTGRITTGDPLKYLERYYKRRAKSAGTASIITRRGHQWAPGKLVTLPALTSAVPVEEFSRSRSYCKWLYARDVTAANSCELDQYRALEAIVLPDYETLPKTEVARSTRYCEWLFDNNRGGFYDCLNSQLLGLRRGSGDFTGVSKDEIKCATAYCEWLYADNRASYHTCLMGQSRGLKKAEPNSNDLPVSEWSRAKRYCAWLYGNNRSAAKACRALQAQSIRRYSRISSSDLPQSEWNRAKRYCEWLYSDNRGSALSCMNSQANAIRGHVQAGTVTHSVPAEVRNYCEWLHGDNRSGYWSCVRSRSY